MDMCHKKYFICERKIETKDLTPNGFERQSAKMFVSRLNATELEPLALNKFNPIQRLKSVCTYKDVYLILLLNQI